MIDRMLWRGWPAEVEMKRLVSIYCGSVPVGSLFMFLLKIYFNLILYLGIENKFREMNHYIIVMFILLDLILNYL